MPNGHFMHRTGLLLFLSLLALVLALGCTSKRQTYIGRLSTEMCAAGNHAPGMSEAECVRACRKEGSPYALVTDGKLYKLRGETSGLDSYAGKQVSIVGVRRHETIHVTSIFTPKS